MSTKTYDPNRVIVTFGGIPLTGKDSVKISPSGDRWTKAVGTDGEVARGKSVDDTNEVSVTLLKTSFSNDYLSNMLYADKMTNAGKLPLSITELGGTTLHFWAEAWLKGDPEQELPSSGDVPKIEWIFQTGNTATKIYGGNII